MIYAYAQKIRLHGKLYVERYQGQPGYHGTRQERRCFRLTRDGRCAGEYGYVLNPDGSRTHVKDTRPAGWYEPRQRVETAAHYDTQDDVDRLPALEPGPDHGAVLAYLHDRQRVALDLELNVSRPVAVPGVWSLYGVPVGDQPLDGTVKGRIRLLQDKLGLINPVDPEVAAGLVYDAETGADVQVFRLPEYGRQLLAGYASAVESMHALVGPPGIQRQWVGLGFLHRLKHAGGLTPLTVRILDAHPEWWPGWEADPDYEAGLQEAS